MLTYNLPDWQAEGCSLEAWQAHKATLKQNFSLLVKEVKAKSSEQPVSAATGEHSGGMDDNSSADSNSAAMTSSDGTAVPTTSQRSSSGDVSSVPPATNNHASGLPLSDIMASIRSELGHALSMPIHDVISQSASMLGLDLAGAVTLKDKAICVARELNIGT